MMASPLMTAREAGAYLRCSRSFLTEHSAELGGRRIGSRLMFLQSDLDAYIARVKIAPPTVTVEPERRPATRLAVVTRGAVNPLDGLPWTAPARRERSR